MRAVVREATPGAASFTVTGGEGVVVGPRRQRYDTRTILIAHRGGAQPHTRAHVFPIIFVHCVWKKDMEEAPAAAPPVSPLLASLRRLSLLNDDHRAAFFASVASQLCTLPAIPADAAATALQEAYSLDFTSGEPCALLVAVKVVISRVASSSYQEPECKESLLADLMSAGLSKAAAEWVRQAAEAAALPCAAQLRSAQGHAAAALSCDYLADFDWQLNQVLASSTLAKINSPLVQLQLKIRSAGTDSERIEELELSPSELDAAISSLSAASAALRSMPEPGK